MLAVDIKIDWLSISIRNFRLISYNPDVYNEGSDCVSGSREYKLRKYVLSTIAEWEHGKGRAPFSNSIHSPRAGWTYFYSPEKANSLIEFTGRGCDQLTIWKSLLPVIRDWSKDLTRIDFACDIVTNTTPAEFAKLRDTIKFRSSSFMTSDTGDTCYVGSRKSDRYARVYKYNDPHPRAGVLRIEMVCKDERAKTAGAAVVSEGLQAVVSALGDTFRWTSPLWSDNVFEGHSDLSIPTETHQGGTERWLLTQVLPAIKKLHEKGSDDAIVYFLGQCNNIINVIDKE